MTQTTQHTLFFTLATLVSLLFASCNDDYSRLGGSLRPERDVVEARGDSLAIETRTVRLDSVYSRTPLTLLGQLSDPVYGDFEASYISRLQCAPGFAFSHEPLEGRIDSVRIEVAYLSAVGDTATWAKASVYEVTQPLPDSRYSTTDASVYASGARLLGQVTYTPARPKGERLLTIPADKELGERFLRASREHPEWFETQQAFEEHLLRGLYVAPTTGSGHVLTVYTTALRIFYTRLDTLQDAHGADSIVRVADWEVFSNNKGLYTLHSLKHAHMEPLLAPSASGYTYIKSPAGVATELKLSRDQLTQLLRSYQSMSRRSATQDWIINEAHLKIAADLPNSETRFNPPPQLLLIPKDSVEGFFSRSISDPSTVARSYISGVYSVLDRSYAFSNVSNLIERHIKGHTDRDADGASIVTDDLVLLLIPVTTEQAAVPGTNGQTVSVINYMIPSAVRLQWGATGQKIGVIGTAFYGNDKRSE